MGFSGRRAENGSAGTRVHTINVLVLTIVVLVVDVLVAAAASLVAPRLPLTTTTPAPTAIDVRRQVVSTTLAPKYHHRIRTYAPSCNVLQSPDSRGKLVATSTLMGFLAGFTQRPDKVEVPSSNLGAPTRRKTCRILELGYLPAVGSAARKQSEKW
jgi:hypothetical protein